MDDDPKYRLTDHAREEAERRSISLEIIASVIDNPGQIVPTHTGRKVYQSKIEMDSKLYIVRIIVEETEPLSVITVYRTSNIKKYWRDDP